MIDDQRLEKRIADDAKRWRDNRRVDPDFASALARLDEATLDGRSVRCPRAALLASAAVVVVAAAVIGVVSSRTSSEAPATGPASLPTCGNAPVTSGTYPRRVSIRLIAPHKAASGTRIRASIELRSADGHPHVINDATSPINLFILYGGHVVGRYRGVEAGTGLGVRLSGHARVRTATEPLLLSGCPTGPLDPSAPDIGRKPLPAGRYQLVAALLSEGRRRWSLVTPPVAITVTAR